MQDEADGGRGLQPDRSRRQAPRQSLHQQPQHHPDHEDADEQAERRAGSCCLDVHEVEDVDADGRERTVTEVEDPRGLEREHESRPRQRVDGAHRQPGDDERQHVGHGDPQGGRPAAVASVIASRSGTYIYLINLFVSRPWPRLLSIAGRPQLAPGTGICAPVIERASSLRRKATTSAMSAGETHPARVDVGWSRRLAGVSITEGRSAFDAYPVVLVLDGEAADQSPDRGLGGDVRRMRPRTG